MSFHVPFRSFNRSQRSRLNGATPTATASVYANVDSPRVQRDLARHASIGALIQAGDGYGFTSDGYLYDGGQVSKTAAGSLNLTVAAGRVTRANGNSVSIVATTTLAVAAGVVGGPRIDVVAIDTTSGAAVVVGGTGTASANVYNKLGLVADLPANRVPIALVIVPTSAANLDAATVINLR